MRHILFFTALTCFLVMACKTQQVPGNEPTPMENINYDSLWSEIDSVERLQLFRSALAKAEKIHAIALERQNDPQWVKAVMYLSKYAVYLNEDGLVHAIGRMEEALDNAGQPAKSVLYNLTAKLYAIYLQQHAWTLQDRTNLNAEPGVDIRTWDIAQLIAKINEYYFTSLEEPTLKELPVTSFEAILTGTGSDYLRPTLFDLLAHEAVQYFRQDYAFITEPVYAFRLTDVSALEPAGDFIDYTFETPDERSYQRKTLELFQELLRLHIGDPEPLALIDVDLERLAFAHQRILHEDKDTVYEQTLRRMVDEYQNEESFAIIAFHLAQFLVQKENEQEKSEREYLVEANNICDQVIERWPSVYGADRCRNLQRQIQRKQLYVRTEQVSLPARPILAQVTYRNISEAFIRIVELKDNEIRTLRGKPKDILRRLKQKTPLQEKELTLPGADDFREHTAEFDITSLPLGTYALLISDDEDFSTEATNAYAKFHISNLAYWHETDDLVSQIAVMDRMTGSPKAGVEVEFWISRYNSLTRENEFIVVGRDMTSDDGIATLPTAANRQQILPRLIDGDDVLFLDDGIFHTGRPVRRNQRATTLLFTDRSIYRPGQTIYYKGYALRFDQEGIPSIRPNVPMSVQLLDANRQEVSTDTVTTNSYGTFTGSFMAPEGRLLGRMSIRCQPGDGQRAVQVEEYKRPTFEIAFSEADESFTLDDTVTVSGSAMTFSGVAVDRATFRYRVIRKTNYPWWPWWRIRPPRSEADMVIAQGEGETADDGSFVIDFLARSEKHAQNAQPEYRFTVEVDVTDITGETRSATKSVILGELGFRFDITLSEQEDLADLRSVELRAENLNGEPVEILGSVRISRLDAPDRPLRERYWDVPDQVILTDQQYRNLFPVYALPGKERISQWDVSDLQGGSDFRINGDAVINLADMIREAGAYRLQFSIGTSESDTATIVKYLHCTDLEDSDIPSYMLVTQAIEHQSIEPGREQLHRVAGNVGLHIRYTTDKRSTMERKWIILNATHNESIPVVEDDRGGFYLGTATVYDSRVYVSSHRVNVPWTNKQLNFEYLTFRDKTEPGAEEEWRIRISGNQSDGVVAEMLATMYDASLDALLPHNWNMSLYPGYSKRSALRAAGFTAVMQRHLTMRPAQPWSQVESRTYRQINWFRFPFYGQGVRFLSAIGGRRNLPAQTAPGEAVVEEIEVRSTLKEMQADLTETSERETDEPQATQEQPSPPSVQVRRDLAETVFFYPHLESGQDGSVELRFTMKESLTRWKFLGLAHTKDLKYGLTEKTLVTQKEIMVSPFVPRFVRQNDTIRLTAKVNNLADSTRQCEVWLELEDLQGADVLDLMHSGVVRQTLTLPAHGSAHAEWQLVVPPDFISPLTYQVIARSGNKGDGEEGVMPVLTDRVFVTETMAMFVPSGSEQSFSFASLRDATSVTRVPHQLTVEFTSNPAWYAVQALPYLKEYPHACSEQQFNRLYANLLGGHIVESFPAIRRVFDEWSAEGNEALLSPLQKNQELKSALLEETPWVREAMSEEEQRRNLALLMDLHKLSMEANKTLMTLKELQLNNGGFPWFAGGRDNWYITQYIVESAGHLNNLGAVPQDIRPQLDQMLHHAVAYIDQRFMEYYEELKLNVEQGESTWDDNHLNNLIVHYLYARSFYKDHSMDKAVRTALDFFLGQSEEFWPDHPLYTQGLITLALHRWTESPVVATIRQSFEERSLQQEELGRYWKQTRGYYWYQLPIERQALMIEVFTELNAPQQFVDELRLWLLTNKQTNRWSTTKATAAAVYALLMHSDSWLEGVPVRVEVGRKLLSMEEPDAGSLYVKESWNGENVTPEMATLKVANPNDHASWGGAYWQYFEDIDMVAASNNGPLSVAKAVYREMMTDQGAELQPLNGQSGQLKVGDKLVVRLEINTDRDMEFVHLKDMRGSGLEPVNVLSGYRWKAGLGYYESTGDLAMHFFFDILPRGKWVFEYPLRVAHAGNYTNGIATLQCMYAPEFSSHSGSVRMSVQLQ